MVRQKPACLSRPSNPKPRLGQRRFESVWQCTVHHWALERLGNHFPADITAPQPMWYMWKENSIRPLLLPVGRNPRMLACLKPIYWNATSEANDRVRTCKSVMTSGLSGWKRTGTSVASAALRGKRDAEQYTRVYDAWTAGRGGHTVSDMHPTMLGKGHQQMR